MLIEFQKVLLTPQPSSEDYLKKVQGKILNTLQTMLPQDYDYSDLAKIFQSQSQQDNLPSFTYQLTQYFINIINENFVNSHTYFLLQQQTQKLESTIRGHIKMEQEMKMYLEHLQYKIQRYEYHFNRLRNKSNNKNHVNQLDNKFSKDKDNLQCLKKKETQLLKERLLLLKKVQHLERRLKDQQIQLRRLNSPVSSTIQQIKDGLFNKQSRQRQALQDLNHNLIVSQQNKWFQEKYIDCRIPSYSSLCSNELMTQKKSSIPAHVPHNYLLTCKEVNLSNNSDLQKIETKKEIINQLTFLLEN